MKNQEINPNQFKPSSFLKFYYGNEQIRNNFNNYSNLLRDKKFYKFYKSNIYSKFIASLNQNEDKQLINLIEKNQNKFHFSNRSINNCLSIEKMSIKWLLNISNRLNILFKNIINIKNFLVINVKF